MLNIYIQTTSVVEVCKSNLSKNLLNGNEFKINLKTVKIVNKYLNSNEGWYMFSTYIFIIFFLTNVWF
jgi:hypothetical protein